MRVAAMLAGPAGRVVLDPDTGAELDRLLEVPDVLDLLIPLLACQVSRVGRLVRPGAPTWIVKRYDYAWLHGLCWLGFGCKARREFEVLRELARLGNPVRPVAWAERRRLGVVHRALLVTEEMAGARDHRSHRRMPAGSGASRRARGLSLVSAARRLAALHDAGWHLRDAHDKNLLVRERDGSFVETGWIDLPRARRGSRPADPSRRADDLATVDRGLRRTYSRTTRLALLLAYLGKTRCDAEVREVLAAVAVARRRRDKSTPLRALRHRATRRLRRLPGVRRLLGYRSWRAETWMHG